MGCGGSTPAEADKPEDIRTAPLGLPPEEQQQVVLPPHAQQQIVHASWVPDASVPLAPALMLPMIEPTFPATMELMPAMVTGVPMSENASPAQRPAEIGPGSLAEKVEQIREALGIEPGPMPSIVDQAAAQLGVTNDGLVPRADACHAMLFKATTKPPEPTPPEPTEPTPQRICTAPGDGFHTHAAGAVAHEDAPPNGASGPVMRWGKGHQGPSGMQWCGWRFHVAHGHWLRMSCWIKFVDRIPPPSGNFGVKIQGQVDNSWVRECQPDVWKYISVVKPSNPGGDDNHHLLIFDSIHGPQEVRFAALTLEVFESGAPPHARVDTTPQQQSAAKPSAAAPAPCNALTYGSTIKLQHIKTGARLHSHGSNYPGGSRQQQVTCFHGSDDNDWWLVKAGHGAPQQAGDVPEGAVIRLEHVATRRNLHSHNISAHTQAGQQNPPQKEVSCFGNDGNGDANCNWRIFYNQDGDESALRFQHVNMGNDHGNHFLHSHGLKYPGWGHGQQEVTICPGKNGDDLWRVQERRVQESNVEGPALMSTHKIKLVSENGACRLDVGGASMKKEIDASHESWATRLYLRRLDGPNEGPVRLGHLIGVFSENGKCRLDVGHGSVKECKASHESWATRLFVRPIGHPANGPAVPLRYNELVGIFSEDGRKRLDIGHAAVHKECAASHNSWATRLFVRAV